MRISEESNKKMLILEESNKIFFNEFIGTNNKTGNSDKGNEILKAFSNMISFTKMELAKKFTEEECRLVVNAVEGHFYSCDISAKYYIDNLIQKHVLFKESDVDDELVKSTRAKIAELSEFQAYTILLSTFEYLKSDRTDLYKFFLCRKNEGI